MLPCFSRGALYRIRHAKQRHHCHRMELHTYSFFPVSTGLPRFLLVCFQREERRKNMHYRCRSTVCRTCIKQAGVVHGVIVRPNKIARRPTMESWMDAGRKTPKSKTRKNLQNEAREMGSPVNLGKLIEGREVAREYLDSQI